MFILVLKCNCMCICVYFIIQTLSTQRQYIAIVQIGYCSSWSIFSIVALDFSSNVSIVQPCNSKTLFMSNIFEPPPPTSLQPLISSTLHYQLFIQCVQFTVGLNSNIQLTLIVMVHQYQLLLRHLFICWFKFLEW